LSPRDWSSHVSSTEPNSTGGSAACTTAAGDFSPVLAGGYLVTCGLGTLTSTNYSFSFVNTGKLTVNQASLTVTSNDAAKTYGDTNTIASGWYSTVRRV